MFEKPDQPFRESRYIQDFQALENRARKGCPVCRIIRCALYSVQITRSQAKKLSDCAALIKVEVVEAVQTSLSYVPPHSPVSDHLPCPDLLITLKDTDKEIQGTCRVACMPEYNPERLNLKMPHNSESPETFNLVKKWMKNCGNRCDELAWSKKAPTYLIQILSEDGWYLRLVRSNDKSSESNRIDAVRYACLSYSWGCDESDLEDRASIRRGKTNSQNLEARKRGFNCSDLPNTMRHAIELVKRVGIDYIWIDSVCIVRDEESADYHTIPVKDTWNHNALRMHEVYGNARLTLCVCATNKATEPLFFPRRAWTYKSVPCTLGDTWLTNYDMTLNEVRQQAPIFKRGWILQEERLSARVLYWSGQRLYWSCGCGQQTEMPESTIARKPRVHSLLPLQGCHNYDWLGSPQKFLELRGGGLTEEIHPLWLDMVQDFTQRNMYTKFDKIPAMSGLAAQYLAAFTPAKEEYIVGLWRATFAKDLAWKVVVAQNPKKAHKKIAPSFSWMSLPFECETKTQEVPHTPCESFMLLNRSEDMRQRDVLERVEQGNRRKRVTLRCRTRKFLPRSSAAVDWSSITAPREHTGSAHDALRQYDFSKCLDRAVHSRDKESGKIVMREIHKDPIIGQLDYHPPTSSPMFPANGFEHSLHALEIGKCAMLLVVRVRRKGPRSVYRRVGIAWTKRENFFDPVTEVEEAILI